ncbi:methionyl aminopeptidase [Pseudohyphozyma bogoriensis]|nr:methionyl aminopeptidase [Pseudohyphozyma bogoriensis]
MVEQQYAVETFEKPKPRPTVTTSTSYAVPCMNCGKPGDSKLMCPKCQKEGIRDGIFCSQQCFSDNWKAHKLAYHTKAAVSDYKFPEGTYDPFANVPNHYTGPLRAVYPDVPVPKREVPAHIPKPDYATEVKGRSMTEMISRSRDRFGKVLNKEEIEGMRKVCRLSREVLDIAAAALRPGITTLEIDEIVHSACIERDAYPSPLGYRMFPRSVCTSINEIICHGIPDARPLESGDVINIDVSLFHGGFHGDVNATYPVGDVFPRNLELLATSRRSLDESIRACKPGVYFKDIGGIIEPIVTEKGFSTNRTYVGHGINQLFHPAPDIPHYAGSKTTIGKMKAGMTFTIEPMICTGLQQDIHWKDNWTAATQDGKPSAQFEETLLVTETGVEVLTAAPGWVLPPLEGRKGRK